jgi:hypothetical protein
MNSARNIEPEMRLKAAQLHVEMGDWMHSLAPWQVISHLTLRWEASIWSAARCYEKFMRTELRGVSHFCALEANPGRDGFHPHAVWCDCLSESRRHLWRKWFEQYGRNRIEPVNSRDDVSDYCAKYVTKAGAWWNVKLVGHRHPEFAEGFKLSGGPCLAGLLEDRLCTDWDMGKRPAAWFGCQGSVVSLLGWPGNCGESGPASTVSF